MVGIRTNLFATPSLRGGTNVLMLVRMGEVWWKQTEFFHTSQTFSRWYMHMWNLRKYLRGSTNMYGSHTHQSVRIAKSTPRGYVLMLVRMGEIWWKQTEFFTRHKRLVDDICTYGSFENIYAGLKICMVAIRTNLFASPSLLRVGTCWCW